MTRIFFLILLSVVTFLDVKAQGNSYQLKKISIGSEMPDIELNGIVNYSKKSAQVSEFKDKLLIFDFWATWCSPCVAALPKMAQLNTKFKDEVQVMLVSYQDKKTIEDFLNKVYLNKSVSLPSITSDSILNKLFPYNSIPHYVWIYKGKVIAITGSGDLTEENIKKALVSKVNLTEKVDVSFRKYDYKSPLLTGENSLKNNSVLYHSALTKYVPGLYNSVTYIDSGEIFQGELMDNSKIIVTNYSVSGLFKFAFGEYKEEFNVGNRIKIEISDSALFKKYTGNEIFDSRKKHTNIEKYSWMEENTYCYELITPAEMNRKKRFTMMQQDIERMFPLTGRVEKVKAMCLVLQRTSNKDLIKTKGGNPDFQIDTFSVKLQNKPINILMSQFISYFFQNSELPILNEVVCDGNIDIQLTCDLRNLEAVNKELKKYDLAFVKEERVIDFVIISERK